MQNKIELLAPGGDVDSIKAAILAGADAIYCGLNKFNARNRATNISFDNLQAILSLAHKNNCKVFITLNIIIVDSEIPDLIRLLNKLVNTSIDGVIVQDLGMFYLLSKYFKSLKVHASTQLTTHNEGQIKFLSKLNVERVNLSRELNINEIKYLTTIAHNNSVLTEVFVHGSYCISFSGICYISSVHGGNSGNRGRCSQPCRDQYLTTAAGNNFPLNLKDNSAFFDLKELAEAGVNSLKIEGRIKKYHYVYTVVNSWRKQLNLFQNKGKLLTNNSDLYKVFNRDFSNAFLKGDISKDMFIDNSRDNSMKYLAESIDSASELKQTQAKLFSEKYDFKIAIEAKIEKLSINKAPLLISISGDIGSPLQVSVITPDFSFVILSDAMLANKGSEALSYAMVEKRLKVLNDTEYYIKDLELNSLQANVFIPFKELTSIKKQILFKLNGKETIDPITVPVFRKHKNKELKPTLSVLIDSPNDILHIKAISANIYYQLPNCFKDRVNELVELFIKNKELIPWFPSVLIGNDYTLAVDFLLQIKPKYIISNNTGIAYQAYKNGIEWIAGPYLNIVNSYSLLCLKENFACKGAFISNEINKMQIKSVKKPSDFELHYCIYHPLVLMTSRLCLFHQVTSCEKNKLDSTCIQYCEKTSTITNLKNDTLFIEKGQGNYHCIYNSQNFLNLDIVKDIPNKFSNFIIDLREIKSNTKVVVDKISLVKLFEEHVTGNESITEKLEQAIHNVTNTQYKKGI